MIDYIDETYIKGFVPELARLLWSGETDYSKQKQAAEQIVTGDFARRGYRDVFLRMDLVLRALGVAATSNETTLSSVEDYHTRLRFAIDVKAITGSKTIVLQGSNDQTIWTDVIPNTVTETGLTSYLFNSAFRFYKVVMTTASGSIDYKAYLTETIFDLFLAYKWLELILRDNSSVPGDDYEKKAEYYEKEYDELFDSDVWYNKYGIETIDPTTGLPTAVGFTQLSISRG